MLRRRWRRWRRWPCRGAGCWWSIEPSQPGWTTTSCGMSRRSSPVSAPDCTAAAARRTGPAGRSLRPPLPRIRREAVRATGRLERAGVPVRPRPHRRAGRWLAPQHRRGPVGGGGGCRHVAPPRRGGSRPQASPRNPPRGGRGATATILSATVTETAGRWFCSFQVAVKRTVGRPAHAPKAGRVLGVDAGIKHLAVLSTGELVPNPAPFKAALKKLGKAQRRAARRIGPYDPATRSRRTASNRWRRAQATVARLHATVAAVRADSWHQLTTRLAQQFTTGVVEDLHVAGMVP